MPKISTLGQKLWPKRREQTHTDTQTEKANTEDPFFRKNFFLIFDFLLKGAVRHDIEVFYIYFHPPLSEIFKNDTCILFQEFIALIWIHKAEVI